jgi:hypothetical protein
LGRLAPLAPDTGAAVLSCTIVFHSPQLSQRPAHLGDADPQDWQTYVVRDLTTAAMYQNNSGTQGPGL